MTPDTLIAWDQVRSPLRRNGLFAHADEEREFLRGEWDYVGARLRSIGLWGTVAFMLAAITDFTVLGASPAFFGILALRFVVVGLGVHLVRLGRRREAPASQILTRALSVFEGAIVAIFLLVVAAYGGAIDYHAITALLLVIALYAYAPALSSVSLWLGPAFTLLFLLEAVFVLHAQPKVTSIVAVLLAFVNFAGWQIAVQFNRMQRLNWLDRQHLRREVAERLDAEQRALVGEESLRRLFDITPIWCSRASWTGACCITTRQPKTCWTRLAKRVPGSFHSARIFSSARNSLPSSAKSWRAMAASAPWTCASRPPKTSRWT